MMVWKVVGGVCVFDDFVYQNNSFVDIVFVVEMEVFVFEIVCEIGLKFGQQGGWCFYFGMGVLSVVFFIGNLQ